MGLLSPPSISAPATTASPPLPPAPKFDLATRTPATQEILPPRPVADLPASGVAEPLPPAKPLAVAVPSAAPPASPPVPPLQGAAAIPPPPHQPTAGADAPPVANHTAANTAPKPHSHVAHKAGPVAAGPIGGVPPIGRRAEPMFKTRPRRFITPPNHLDSDSDTNSLLRRLSPLPMRGTRHASRSHRRSSGT